MERRREAFWLDPLFFLHQHRVERGDAHQPGHERRVFDRVPGPVAAEGEGDVGPVAAHGDADAEEENGGERPRQGRAHPLGKSLFPEGCDGKGKGHDHRRKARKQHGRVNRHPRVLEQVVKALSVRRHEAGILLEDGRVRKLLRQGEEGGGADLEGAELEAGHHRQEEELADAHHGHHGRFVFPLHVGNQRAAYGAHHQNP